MNAATAKQTLEKFGNVDDAAFLQRFFKTGAGEYGEGDQFIGVRVPKIRLVAREFRELPRAEAQKLLDSPVHEHRMCAVIILTLQFARAKTNENKHEIYEMYLQNVHDGRINNWDLVDITAYRIVGEYLRDKPHDILPKLAKSKNIWERRVAAVSTFDFLKYGDPSTSLAVAEILLHDPQDLIQKAVGWVLREVGKLDKQLLLDFLNRHAHEMPRTMLRYSLEKLPPDLRQKYLAQKTPV